MKTMKNLSVLIILLISLSTSAQSTSAINVCMNDQAITLDPSYTWSGPGVGTNNTFYPFVVGVGEYTLTGKNNQDEKTIKIMVYPPPVVVFESIQPTTTNTPPTELKTNLTGGTFEGKGVDGKYFYPAVAGIGTHIIQYVYQHKITKCTTIVVQYVVVS